MSWGGTTQRARSVLNAVIRDLPINGIFRGNLSVENVMRSVIKVKSSGASSTRNEIELSIVVSANGTGGSEKTQ
jgi:hypothetical protein